MKMIGVELRSNYSDVYTIKHEVIDVLKETNTMYKLGNHSSLMYHCRSQITKNEINRVLFYDFEDRNDKRSDRIVLNIYDVCAADEVDTTVVRLRNTILEFTKAELAIRIMELKKLQEKINQIVV
jgi:hypothetical protein